MRESIQKSISEQMSLSMIDDSMQGGWKQEHVHSSGDGEDVFHDAPDKEQAIPVINRSAEPIVVEYDPGADHEEEQKREQSFIEIEDESNLVDINLKSTMTQEPLVQPEPVQQKGMFRSIVEDLKTAAKEMLSDSVRTKRVESKISLAQGPESAEVYTEVTKVDSKKVHAHVTWKLKNISIGADWAPDMQLIPVMSSPTLRIHFESNICQLR